MALGAKKRSEKDYGWVESFKKGDKGEDIFVTLFPEYEKIGEKYKADVRHKQTLTLLELKTDYTDSTKFFIETYSNFESKTWGGPWGAKEKGCSEFCYYFINRDEFYFFDLDSLLYKLRKIFNILSKDTLSQCRKEIRNKNHTTVGYAFPITMFEGIYTKQYKQYK